MHPLHDYVAKQLADKVSGDKPDADRSLLLAPTPWRASPACRASSAASW